MCLAVDEHWFQSHQNVVWVFDTQQYAAAVYARRRVLCLKRRAADKIGIARQFRRDSIPADSIEGFCDMNDLYAAPLTKM